MLGRWVQVGVVGWWAGALLLSLGQREGMKFLSAPLASPSLGAGLCTAPRANQHQLVPPVPSINGVRHSKRQIQCALIRSTGPFFSASQLVFLPNWLPYWPTATLGQPVDSSPAQSLPGDFSLVLQTVSFWNLTSLALPRFHKVWSWSQIPFSVPLTVVPFCLHSNWCAPAEKAVGERSDRWAPETDSRSVLLNYCSQANVHPGALAKSKSTHLIPESHQKSSHFLCSLIEPFHP